MANKITETVVLGIGIEYTNPETEKTVTEYVKIVNPRSGLTKTTIQTAMQNYLTGNVFFDKSTYSPLVGASTKTAYTERTRVTDYDIGFFDD